MLLEVELKNLSEILFQKLEEGYRIKIAMNSLRVKMCSITKGPYNPVMSPFENFDGSFGGGPTTQTAIEDAIRSFKSGYRPSGYSTGDTETHNLLEQFVHSGYNVYFWLDSGLAIMQVRYDIFCKIPASVLLEAETNGTVDWINDRHQKCITQESEIDIMRNDRFPKLKTYLTVINGPEFFGNKSHHIFKRIPTGANLFDSFLAPKLIS